MKIYIITKVNRNSEGYIESIGTFDGYHTSKEDAFSRAMELKGEIFVTEYLEVQTWNTREIDEKTPSAR